jgi:hypothetical protein
MAKALDAPYEAGRRGASWLKVKRAHTLDLVVLAAEWGHGRRHGWLSNLHLGARDPSGAHSPSGWVMLGKTFKGMTDALLEWQTAELLAREVRRDSGTVWVRPELVVEIAFNDLQESPHYPGGLALRFARVKGYREDKGRGGRGHDRNGTDPLRGPGGAGGALIARQPATRSLEPGRLENREAVVERKRRRGRALPDLAARAAGALLAFARLALVVARPRLAGCRPTARSDRPVFAGAAFHVVRHPSLQRVEMPHGEESAGRHLSESYLTGVGDQPDAVSVAGRFPRRASGLSAPHLALQNGDEVLLGLGELGLVAVVHLAEEGRALRRAGLFGVLDVLVVRHERLRLVLDQRDPVVGEVAQGMGVAGLFLHDVLLWLCGIAAAARRYARAAGAAREVVLSAVSCRSDTSRANALSGPGCDSTVSPCGAKVSPSPGSPACSRVLLLASGMERRPFRDQAIRFGDNGLPGFRRHVVAKHRGKVRVSTNRR